MIKHQQHNRIFSIKSREGQRLLQHEEIENELLSYFHGMITKTFLNRIEYSLINQSRSK
jgi:hypothetical protein